LPTGEILCDFAYFFAFSTEFSKNRAIVENALLARQLIEFSWDFIGRSLTRRKKSLHWLPLLVSAEIRNRCVVFSIIFMPEWNSS